MAGQAAAATRSDILYLAGPTGSGKTAVSTALAQAWDAEIISCDAFQIYQGLDIGTAKATPAEQAAVPHHLVDILPPGASFSVADFVRLAGEAANQIRARGRRVVVVGGNFQYMESLRSGQVYEAPPSDPEVRAAPQAEADRVGREAMHQRLEALDPDRAAALHPNDLHRVIRALEIIELSGQPASAFGKPVSGLSQGPYAGPLVALRWDRDALYERINRRVDQMLADGLVEEAHWAWAQPGFVAAGAAQAIAYKELKPYLDGVASLEACQAELKQASRNYAKRQMSWLRQVPGLVWWDVGPETSQDEVAAGLLQVLSD